MICSHCGTATVKWKGPITALTHTECSNCGGINCHVVEPDDDDNEDEDPPQRIVHKHFNIRGGSHD